MQPSPSQSCSQRSPPLHSLPLGPTTLCHVWGVAVGACGACCVGFCGSCESGIVALCPHLCAGHAHSQWWGAHACQCVGKVKFTAAEHQVGGERGLVAPWGAALHCLRTLQPTLCHFGPKAGKDATHKGFKSGCWPPHQWHAAVSLAVGPAGGAMGCAAPPGCLGGQS